MASLNEAKRALVTIDAAAMQAPLTRQDHAAVTNATRVLMDYLNSLEEPKGLHAVDPVQEDPVEVKK